MNKLNVTSLSVPALSSSSTADDEFSSTTIGSSKSDFLVVLGLVARSVVCGLSLAARASSSASSSAYS